MSSKVTATGTPIVVMAEKHAEPEGVVYSTCSDDIGRAIENSPLAPSEKVDPQELFVGGADEQRPPRPILQKHGLAALTAHLIAAIQGSTTCEDLDRALALAELHSALNPSAKGDKNVVAVLENFLRGSDALLGDQEAIFLKISQLLRATKNTNSKEVILLIRRLQDSRQEEAAAHLVSMTLQLSPYAVGYFKPALVFRQNAIRSRLIEGHFANLRSLGDSPAALEALATQLVLAGAFQEATEIFEKGFEGVDHPKIATAHASALFWTDRFLEAMAIVDHAFERFAELTVKESVILLKIKARSEIALGRSEEAIKTLRACRENYPETYLMDATDIYAGLSVGRYGEAFDIYWAGPSMDALRLLPASPVERAALIQAHRSGLPIKGECSVLCVMGLGDEIRFAQLLDEIAGLFERVTLFSDRRVAAVIARSFPRVHVRAVDSSRPAQGARPLLSSFMDEEAFDHVSASAYVADLKQFPTILRTLPDDFPSEGHRLSPIEAMKEKWSHFLTEKASRPVIGLFWRSDLLAYTASHKQTALTDWTAPLSRLPIDIVPLQYELTADERCLLAENDQFIDLPQSLDLRAHVEDVLALLSVLPLTVSLPGTMQHLAGAVGARVLCPAHPFEASWRRRFGSVNELWSPSVEIVSGQPERGLAGSIERTVERLELWLRHLPGPAM